MPQAYNGMGYSYRKLGDYTKALENYDRALQLAPKFPDAIEYRGEAYLALNRLDDAKQAYLTLFAHGSQAGGQPDDGDEGLRREEEGGSVGRRCGSAVGVRELDHRARGRCRADEADGVRRAPRILAIASGPADEVDRILRQIRRLAV